MIGHSPMFSNLFILFWTYCLKACQFVFFRKSFTCCFIWLIGFPLCFIRTAYTPGVFGSSFGSRVSKSFHLKSVKSLSHLHTIFTF